MAFFVVEGNRAIHLGQSSTSSMRGPTSRHKTVTNDPSVGRMCARIESNEYCGHEEQNADLERMDK